MQLPLLQHQGRRDATVVLLALQSLSGNSSRHAVRCCEQQWSVASGRSWDGPHPECRLTLRAHWLCCATTRRFQREQLRAAHWQNQTCNASNCFLGQGI